MTAWQIAQALADAMLSGPADAAGAQQRCARTLGHAHRFLPALARAMVGLHGTDWSPALRERLAQAIVDHPAFLRARHTGVAMLVRQLPLLPAAMAPRPLPLAACAVPDLPTPADLARWLGIGLDDLDWLAQPSSRRRAQHYACRWLPKRAGGWRLVESPKARLRAVQRRILTGLLDAVPPHDAAHGFRAGRSILSNASAHVGRRVVIGLDLQDFFLSLRRPRVEALYRTLGYPSAVSRILARLCTNAVAPEDFGAPDPDRYGFDRPDASWGAVHTLAEWHLPQGAPTSPALSNLCAYALDVRLQAAAERFGATYTRYADDLTFSGDAAFLRRAGKFVPFVGAIVGEEGLQVNFRKTMVMTRSRRQEVTGVVVNDHPNVRRDEYDKLKAALHNCARHGPAAENRSSVPDFRAHLAGRIAHVAMLQPSRGQRLQALFSNIDWGTPASHSSQAEP